MFYATGKQTRFEVPVFQGGDNDPRRNIFLGQVGLDGLPGEPEGVCRRLDVVDRQTVVGHERRERVECAGLVEHLGHDLEPQGARQADDRTDDRGVVGVDADAVDEGAVDLEDVDREPLEVRQRAEAGAEVV